MVWNNTRGAGKGIQQEAVPKFHKDHEEGMWGTQKLGHSTGKWLEALIYKD